MVEYINENWVFAAIRLVRSEKGINTPHPIRMVFSSEKPIYPMKLTSIAGGSPYFEIFVIGDSRASTDFLPARFCDRYRRNRSRNESPFYYEGESYEQDLGYSGILPLMWNGCVLTKFSGTINSEEMTRDIYFDWEEFKPYRELFFTTQGSLYSVTILFLGIIGIYIFTTMLLFHKRISEKSGKVYYLRKILLPGVLCAVTISSCVYFLLPKIGPEGDGIHTTKGYLRMMSVVRLQWAMYDILGNNPQVLNGSEDEIETLITKKLAEENMRNNIQGTDVIPEDTPGNFTVEKNKDEVIIYMYDRIGVKHPLKENRTEGQE